MSLPKIAVASRLASASCRASNTVSIAQTTVRPQQSLYTCASATRSQSRKTLTHTLQQAIPRRLFATQPRLRAAASSSPAPPIGQASNNLPWDSFFTIRRARRTFTLIGGVVGVVTAVSVVVPVLGDYDLETPISQATGIEPYYAGLYGLAAAGVTVVILGYVGGRVLSNLVFSVGLRARGWSTAFGEKENSLLHRVKRYRADPSNSSPQNPIPDYYGEKIRNVVGYRRWLRDQRIYQKKMYRDKLPDA